VCGYSTIWTEASQVIAAIPPIDLLIEEREMQHSTQPKNARKWQNIAGRKKQEKRNELKD